MNQLEKMNETLKIGNAVCVIPEYKCRKCGAIFKLDRVLYPLHPGYYTTFHLECSLYSECSEDYVGIADLQGFTEIK